MKKSFTFAILAAAAVASSASAAVIAPGQTAIAVNEANPVGGTVVATQVTGFVTANYTGTLISQAISGDTTNIYGGITFTYSLTNDAPSANAITRLNVTGFTAYATDMSYQLGTGGVIPIYNDRDTSGGVVGYWFLGSPIGNGVLAAGTTSELLVVQTNSTSFSLRNGNVSNGAVTPVLALGPAGAITPEPASLGVLGALSLVLRRRR